MTKRQDEMLNLFIEYPFIAADFSQVNSQEEYFEVFNQYTKGDSMYAHDVYEYVGYVNYTDFKEVIEHWYEYDDDEYNDRLPDAVKIDCAITEVWFEDEYYDPSCCCCEEAEEEDEDPRFARWDREFTTAFGK